MEKIPVSNGSLRPHYEVVQGIKKSLVDRGDKAIKRIAEKAKMAGIVFEGKVVEGHPATDIIKMAVDTGADLIVMGSIGVTRLEKYLLGSVAEMVVRNSKVPVMVVR